MRSAAICPTDFGFPIDVHANEPETIYVVPIKSDSEHFPPEGKLRVYRSRTGGNEWEALTQGLPQKDCYVNVLRDAMAVDSLEPCGVYFGTTGGQGYASTDSGDSWNPIVRDLLGGLVGRSPEAAMIRVVLPYHLRMLARVEGEVQLEVEAVRPRSARRSTRWKRAFRRCAGRCATTRTLRRRPFIRFFACKEDLSNESPDTKLPDAGHGKRGAVYDCRGHGGEAKIFEQATATRERHNMSKSKNAMAARIIWFEIPADNPERAQKFYSSMFGWKINPFPGATDYWHIETGGGG